MINTLKLYNLDSLIYLKLIRTESNKIWKYIYLYENTNAHSSTRTHARTLFFTNFPNQFPVHEFKIKLALNVKKSFKQTMFNIPAPRQQITPGRICTRSADLGMDPAQSRLLSGHLLLTVQNPVLQNMTFLLTIVVLFSVQI